MKLSLPVLAAGLLPLVLALGGQKSVVVTYPDDTPGSVIDSAKDALTEAVCSF